MQQLSELISVAPRYARSVNIERDGFTEASIEGYVVTATAEEFLLRFGRALAGAGGHRAWTLTGPYGAGKSSFALFMANLFSPAEVGGSKAARRLLKEQHTETYQELFEQRGKGRLGKEGFTAADLPQGLAGLASFAGLQKERIENAVQQRAAELHLEKFSRPSPNSIPRLKRSSFAARRWAPSRWMTSLSISGKDTPRAPSGGRPLPRSTGATGNATWPRSSN